MHSSFERKKQCTGHLLGLKLPFRKGPSAVVFSTFLKLVGVLRTVIKAGLIANKNTDALALRF